MDSSNTQKIRDNYNDSGLCEYFKELGQNFRHNSISSSLDWIEYALELYNACKNDTGCSWQTSGAFNQCFNLILSSDIIVTNIENIFNKVTVNHNYMNKNFEKTRNVNKEILDKLCKSNKNVSDYNLFKKIRAIMGFHNSDIDGKDKVKYYSSWPTNFKSDSLDWNVLLYNNQNGKLDLFSIDLEEIKKYVENKFDELYNFKFERSRINE